MTIRPDIPSIENICIDMAVRHIVAARDHLQAAIYKIDDAGFKHDPTARSYSFVAGIVAEFSGRAWRPVPPVPQHIEEAAQDYRRARRRTY